MEQTIFLKGVALFSALTSIQQWLFYNITIFDMMFLVLIVAFLITLERDYLSYTQKHQREGDNSVCEPNQSSKSPFFLKTQISFIYPINLNYFKYLVT